MTLAMSSYDNEPLLEDACDAQIQSVDGELFNNASWPSAQNSNSYLTSARTQIRRLLVSRAGHYAVLLLVALDVCCILTDFLISLFICERAGAKNENKSDSLAEAQAILGIVSLVFSCLFVAELIASIWAFGFKLLSPRQACTYEC